jgi:hypothetical protein
VSESITIHGVPAAVSRTDVLAAIETLGIDPKQISGLRFDHDAIHVEVFSDGKPNKPGWRWTHNGENVATHRLTIPIIEKEPTP